MQVKLLRVLQERELRPVGSTTLVSLDVRVLSASHHNLEDEVKAGRFREDLFYRLNVVGLHLPTLAERREDIPLLAQHFMSALAQRYGKQVSGFAPGALELMATAQWPGNIRQLQNAIEKCIILTTGPVISLPLVQRTLNTSGVNLLPFDEARRHFERDYLAQILKMTHGNVSQAARLAQRNRTDFYTLLGRHQLNPADFKRE